MKQSVAWIVVVVVLIGGAAGGFFLWQKSQIDAVVPTGPRDLDAAAVRDILAKSAGVNLPASASDIQGCEQAEVGHWVAARFDLPTPEASSWLAGESKLGKAVAGKAGEEMFDEMGGCSTWVNRAWWNVGEITSPVCGQSQGTRKTPAGEAKWRLRTCMVTLPENKTRIYILYSDDLAGAPAATQPVAKK